jgi:hypothetical protein
MEGRDMKYLNIMALVIGMLVTPYVLAQDNNITITISPDSHVRWTLVCPVNYTVTVNSEDNTLVCTNTHPRWSVNKTSPTESSTTGVKSIAPDTHVRWMPAVMVSCPEGETGIVKGGHLVCAKL